MGRYWLVGVAAAVACSTPSFAAAKCEISQLLQLPVTVTGGTPIVTARFGARPARLILDSGAFYSMLSKASALEYGLRLEPAPSWFRVSGINGDTSASFTTVKDFEIAGVTVPRIDFFVGGTDTGAVGLLGQNLLGIGDVEYDLPHGEVRLLKAKDCVTMGLPYWAADRPVTVVDLVRRDPPFKVHTIGMVTLNGVKLRAAFDTGAHSSMLTLAAAKRLGITPTSPGVAPGVDTTGVGTKIVRTWLATFDALDIGGERIPHPKIRIGDIDLADSDMLIGIDFFLTHRVYVANQMSKMLITYEGGPMFGLTPSGARTSGGQKLDLTDKRAEPTDAEGFARRAAVLGSNGDKAGALRDLDRAVALAPGDARFLRERAMARLADKEPKLAMADLDKAIGLDPADPELRMTRAALRLRTDERGGAAEDLRAADRALARSSDRRQPLSAMFDEIDDYEAALANIQAWLKSHPEDAGRPAALNSRCWERALLNRELADALVDCNAALRARPADAASLDSRALVHLRRGEWQLALADYDAALKGAPEETWSLYGRSVAKRRLGDAAGADADRAAAVKGDPKVLERGRKLGLEG